MSDTQEKIYQTAKESVGWFEISFQIKIFGRVILSYTWPPKN